MAVAWVAVQVASKAVGPTAAVADLGLVRAASRAAAATGASMEAAIEAGSLGEDAAVAIRVVSSEGCEVGVVEVGVVGHWAGR